MSGTAKSQSDLDATAEQAEREQFVTDQVLAGFTGSTDPRYRELMESLVRHLHAFVRETRLTEEEWALGIDFLTRCGQITTPTRQEFILLSDVLGVSMLTIGVNNPPTADTTEATVFGPFFVAGSAQVPLGGDISGGAAGQPCWVSGTVKGTDGRAVAGARLEIWEADENGFYDVQYDDDRQAGRGHLFSAEDGSYCFWAVTPTPYPIPADGPVGDLLTAAGRGPMRAPHLHFMVTADGHRRLVTHIFVRGGDFQDSDAVFGVKESLLVDFVENPAGTAAPDGTTPDRSWTSAEFHIVLATEATEPAEASGDTESAEAIERAEGTEGEQA
jgi:protocatechuate 3,4-dioxygenase beta subunit